MARPVFLGVGSPFVEVRVKSPWRRTVFRFLGSLVQLAGKASEGCGRFPRLLGAYLRVFTIFSKLAF